MNEFIAQQTMDAARQAGEFIGKAAQNFSREHIEHKGLNDLVSYVDKQAEELLVAKCKEILPAAGFITEEGTETTRADEFNWIIDPLDGTTNFMHGLPAYAVSIGLIQFNEPVMGVVYEINRDEMFHAWKGGGAYCNGEVIQTSDINSLSSSLLATGFPYYEFSQMERYLEILNHFMQNTHGLRRMGSAAVDLAYTACGRFEGFFEYNLNAWDIAAGIVLVQEAGGQVTDFSGGEDYLFGRELIAGCKGVQSDMQKTIARFWAAKNQ